MERGPEPGLRTCFTLSLSLGAGVVVGALSTGGVRRIRPALGGHLEGEGLSARLLPGYSAEVRLERASGTAVIEATYVLQHEDGSVVRLNGQGYATTAPYYPGTRMTVMFEVEAFSALAWLGTRVFLAQRPEGTDSFEIALVV
jgi:hypothetical protein